MRNILEFKKPSKKECAHLRVLTNQIRSVVFLNHVLEHPDQIYDYARLYASSVAAILAWGFRARNFESFFFKNFYDFVDQVRLDHSLPGCTNSKKWLEAIEPGANPRWIKFRGCGISVVNGRSERTTSVTLWTRRGRLLGQWLTSEELMETFETPSSI